VRILADLAFDRTNLDVSLASWRRGYGLAAANSACASERDGVLS